jgi:hypothetical protein
MIFSKFWSRLIGDNSVMEQRLKKSIWLEGIRDKTIKDDGAKRVFRSK